MRVLQIADTSKISAPSPLPLSQNKKHFGRGDQSSSHATSFRLANKDSYMEIILTCLFVFILSTFITYLVRFLAIHKNILDIPNERSSHEIPTPRGGGIAIVICFNLSLIWFAIMGMISLNFVCALVGGGILIALIGYYDDIYSVKARTRIIVHLLAALWAVYWIGGFSTLDLGTWKFVLHGKGLFLAVIGIVWCINLYNFMDGIDGLAGSEGLFVASASAVAFWFLHDFNLLLTTCLLAAAIAGFTIWNWPPAKIFLGDVGSGFLGYVFSVLAIYSANQHLLPINFWLILLSVFLCDATFTVIVRALQGKSWYLAHREHAYQNLILRGISHKQTTLGILALNACILLPLAFATLYWPSQSFWLMISAITGLLLIWISIKFNRQ